MGNLAAVLIFTALVLLFVLPAMIAWPFAGPQFGIDLARFEHLRIVGPICAIWLAVFSLPFFLYAKDPGIKGARWINAVREGSTSVLRTVREAAKYRQPMKFLIARMFYADGMAALLALNAVYVALFLEWGLLEMTCMALFASFFAFLGGIFGGWLDTRVGVKAALFIEVIVMIIGFGLQLSVSQDSLLFGVFANYQVWDGLIFQTASDIAYLSMVPVVAVAATASISSSRAMLVTLAPQGRSGEFFGLYAIAGTITVWMGPLLVEVFTNAANSQRIGMASIVMLFAIGLTLLGFVKVEKSEG